MKFTSNSVLEQVCALLPEIDPDWGKICSDDHRKLVSGLQWPQMLSKFSEWYLSDALDAIRDGANTDIVTPSLPLVSEKYVVRDDVRGQHSLYYRITDAMSREEQMRAHSKIGEVDDVRFAKQLGVVFEIKLISTDEQRANKQIEQHAKTALECFSEMFGRVGYCAVVNQLVENSMHQRNVRAMGGNILQSGMGRVQFEKAAHEHAVKYGFLEIVK
ncbi:MAG: hypothetical protein AABY01_02480 [Nanoarchaeota archaeon]